MDIEIKDRVAVGDNKYTMRTLSDGRVELTPSPDSVQEPGTPLNKALLQPMADSAYDVIYSFDWNPEKNKKLVFSNSNQTLSGLVADLDANKNVGVRIRRAGATVYEKAEIIISATSGVYGICFFDFGTYTTVDFAIHIWIIVTDYYNNYEFQYYGRSISEELRNLTIGNVDQADNINALLMFVQILSDRITALESKIS